jgi:head-tail adaptor
MVTFDPSADFADVVDGLESVTLAYREGSSVTVANAHRREVNWHEIEASGGDVRGGDTIWHWPQSESASQPPLGSTITDSDGNVFTILEISPSHQCLAKWVARGRDLVHEARLDTLVTIQSATFAKDADGVAVASWADAYASVRARVQPVSYTAEVEHDADEVERMVRIILESALSIVPGADYRVIDNNGNVYSVIRYEQPASIDVLPVLVCERTGSSGA